MGLGLYSVSISISTFYSCPKWANSYLWGSHSIFIPNFVQIPNQLNSYLWGSHTMFHSPSPFFVWISLSAWVMTYQPLPLAPYPTVFTSVQTPKQLNCYNGGGAPRWRPSITHYISIYVCEMKQDSFTGCLVALDMADLPTGCEIAIYVADAATGYQGALHMANAPIGCHSAFDSWYTHWVILSQLLFKAQMKYIPVFALGIGSPSQLLFQSQTNSIPIYGG